jgi:deoxyribonuclease V
LKKEIGRKSESSAKLANGVRMRNSIERAHQLQSRLSKQIIFEDRLPKKINRVAGVDIAYTENLSIGATAVLSYDSFRLQETSTSFCKTRFQYIPTLLSFREIPPAILSIRKLETEPDVFLIDGHGFAHPYGCGFASHLGLLLGRPTIGVAKTRLVGRFCKREQDVDFLEFRGRIVGAALTTRKGNRPVYVSVGHMTSLSTAIELVRHCSMNSRIPEPILRAHQLATAEKRKINIRYDQQKKSEI